MRLLFDENLSILSARWAAATLAVDVLDARAAGLAGKTDREVIETDRVLVTLDADFGNLIRFSPSGTPGVIWLRPREEEEIPWKCRRLVIGTGTGALPVMEEVKRGAQQRKIELAILPTAEAIKTLPSAGIKSDSHEISRVLAEPFG